MMSKDMKKIIALAMTLGAALTSYSVENRLTGATSYFESAEINTSAKELPMSPYKKGTLVFFRNDTAYSFVPGTEGIDSITPCPELMGLGIEGTFAYDEKNERLYFSKLGSAEKNDLFQAVWKGEKWTNVEMLKIRGVMKQQQGYKNSALAVSRWVQAGRGASGFYNPSLGKDGKRIYFSGEFKAGKGGRDLWFIDQEENDFWTRPQLVSDTNSTKFDEDYPLVVGDTLLYFASQREDGLGGLDIYYAKKAKNADEWQPAQMLTDIVNSSSDDYNVAFGKADGSAFFISNRPEGKGLDDIYAAGLLRPTQDVELTALPMLDEPKGFNWVLFFFDLDKYDMKPEYEVQLDELLSAMAEHPGEIFEISGHTDSRGDDNYNLKLSQKRANFVRDLLIKRGAEAASLKAVGKGETEPIIKDAQTEPEHEQNRRVEIKVIDAENE